MSALVNALLLDPHPFEIWVAVRAEKGTGTLNDPYGANTATAFDTLMNGLPANVRVNLGPGTFLTKGYSDEVSGGWQIKAGMQIVGSGSSRVRSRNHLLCADQERLRAFPAGW